MNTTPNATTPDLFIWPLPATGLPHAHLTWSEYLVWQTAHLANMPDAVQSMQLSSPEMAQNLNSFLGSGTAQRFVWPLPATHLLHAHLTWAEWTAQQAACTNGRQPEIVKRDRAA